LPRWFHSNLIRICDDQGLLSSGRFLAREAGAAAVPAGRCGPEFDPAQDFGAHI
jgi:hypothetical protein